MNKTELIEQVRDKSGLTKAQSTEAVNAVFSSIIEALGKKEPVQIIGFGTFKVRHRKERMSRHPKTGEKIKTPAREVAVFSAGKRLKDSVHLQSPKETQVAKKSKSAAKKSSASSSRKK
ncbi:HU family DNA-binding protein [Candidatus Williamhamiltonella defendens]|uniref:DNA-binding protein HU-beta n=1 Tax=Candidatus Williamhamiltonella defendens TaxID=138072 RepID=A0A2D3TD52_9ENTR|nr:HU family DNA-binding protein [Candidatus Hamiltonella defensa]ATW33624.1 DNA-binding protein [Candidatus Hamiltonella defensa]ATW34174.1 DNA-binding protein [Candidatus Hamiltonella defensa]